MKPCNINPVEGNTGKRQYHHCIIKLFLDTQKFTQTEIEVEKGIPQKIPHNKGKISEDKNYRAWENLQTTHLTD